MRIGYPAANSVLGCTSAHTFRLASFTEERLKDTLGTNLLCLLNTLAYNEQHGIGFFRIVSDLVPFASHEVCRVDWQRIFKPQFDFIGDYVRQHGMRVSMHPGQYTLINSPDEDVFRRAYAELVYHAELFDLMALDTTHKIQIHVGGIYGDKAASIERFAARYDLLPERIKQRLVIENDDRLYSVADCIALHKLTGVPIVFDNLHHDLLNNGDSVREAFTSVTATWQQDRGGVPIVDYSSQATGKRLGNHTQSIDLEHFAVFLSEMQGFEFDLMLEIKDKEASALQALEFLQRDAQRATVNAHH